MLASLVWNSCPHDPPTSASQTAGITGVSHCVWPDLHLYFILFIYLFIFETRSLTLSGWSAVARLWFTETSASRGQAGLELLTSGDLPALVSQSAGITGMSHHAQPVLLILLGPQTNSHLPQNHLTNGIK